MLSVYSGYIKRYLIAVAILSASILVLANSEIAAEAVRKGISMCVGSVIPSLFPMIFLSQYLIKSGAAEEIGKLLNKPAEILFGLPGICGVAVLTGMVGGFPAGARAAETLVSDGVISRKQGQRLAAISFSSGPGFTIGMVGAELYKNKSVGLLILTAQIISSIIIGIALKIFCGKCTSDNAVSSVRQAQVPKRSEAFVESAADTASTIIAMCSFIVVFQVIASMLDVMHVNVLPAALLKKAGLGDIGIYLIPCLTEVTGGSILSVNVGLPFTAFVVGFGGLSVHFQNFAICREIRLNKPKYIFVRLMQGLICSLLVQAALQIPYFSRMCEPVSINLGGASAAEFSRISYGFGAIMLVMCLMSVICLPQKKKIKEATVCR